MSSSAVIQRILRHVCHAQARRHVSAHVANVGGLNTMSEDTSSVDAFQLMKPQMSGLMEDIHTELDNQMVTVSQIGEMAK